MLQGEHPMDPQLKFFLKPQQGNVDIFSSESALELCKVDILSSKSALELGKADILGSKGALVFEILWAFSEKKTFFKILRKFVNENTLKSDFHPFWDF